MYLKYKMKYFFHKIILTDLFKNSFLNLNLSKGLKQQQEIVKKIGKINYTTQIVTIILFNSSPFKAFESW